MLQNIDWLPKPNNVQLYTGEDEVDEGLVCSVFGFVFNTSNQLLMIEKEKGWDIPGGGKKINESPEQAIAREVKEEAAVTINIIKRIAVNKLKILSDKNPVKNWRPFPISYELFYACNTTFINDFSDNVETRDRKFFDIDNAMKQEGIMFGNRLQMLEGILNVLVEI